LAADQVVRAHPAALVEGLEAAACPDLVVAVVGATRPLLGMALEPASSLRCDLRVPVLGGGQQLVHHDAGAGHGGPLDELEQSPPRRHRVEAGDAFGGRAARRRLGEVEPRHEHFWGWAVGAVYHLAGELG
jgi:hypothetical protein